MAKIGETKQEAAVHEVERFKAALGPFVVAAETTRMPMLFTNAGVARHPIIFANNSLLALTDYAREEMLGQNLDLLFAQAGNAVTNARLEAAMECDAGTIEVECRRKDGRFFPAALYMSPVQDERGKVVQHFLSLVDLTTYNEHRLALEQVLNLQAELIHVGRVSAMSTMATTLAHELNQPLTAITNCAAGSRMSLEADPFDVEALRTNLTAIEDSALRAGAIISRLRAMTRGGSTKREAFDLNEAVRESVMLVRAGSCDGVRIDSETDGVVMIEADRVQIQQVIVNLAKNGCEAAAEVPNGCVTVTTSVEGDRAVVAVDDSGPGVAATALTDLFTWSDSAKPNGMGVGLSISQAIMQAHDGEICHEAGGAGRTRFRFSMPLLSQ